MKSILRVALGRQGNTYLNTYMNTGSLKVVVLTEGLLFIYLMISDTVW